MSHLYLFPDIDLGSLPEMVPSQSFFSAKCQFYLRYQLIKELIQYGAQKAVSTGCLACPRMDFPGGPVVGSPPANVGDAGFIPWSRRTPHAVKSLTPRAPITECVL